VVIVGFDPVVDASRLAGFGKAYAAKGPTPAVQVFGPWKGNLSNRGERLGLEKSQAGGDPADAKGWVVVDEAIYSDASPWPIGADGSGNSLQRIHADASHSGNDPANWIVASPSAGIAP
jgi:hypothetical protein